ncbi:hypothetical protein BGZ99_005407 [Dissophora globulifera]|uniref:Uncharacterized protein n=1 Tax=Dissophora globulifera TaxID=979702 RepID=A0A9P6RSK8_9FUNG|nr:hypothetical protein BGZ99_005407 [Dissophora globulifera]
MVQAILEMCPRLKLIMADRITVEDIAQGREWACHGLTELSVYIDKTNASPGLVSSKDMQRVSYTRLATLTKLRVLDLTYDVADWFGHLTPLELTLEAGLELLVTLKDLCIFSFRNFDHRLVGEKERFWMTESWPKVKYVRRQTMDRERVE